MLRFEIPDYIIDRMFERRVITDDLCWESTYTAKESGHVHAQWKVNGKQFTEYLHRISFFILANGRMEKPTHVVRHLCGNPGCWNPDHLASGSKSDNAYDMQLHGTALRGSDCPWSKLNEQLVRDIRESTASDSKWARVLGMTTEPIRRARIGMTWKHVS